MHSKSKAEELSTTQKTKEAYDICPIKELFTLMIHSIQKEYIVVVLVSGYQTEKLQFWHLGTGKLVA